MDYTTYSDEELIRLLREGQKEIADFLMEKYKPLVRKKTNAMYLIGGEAEDLIQEGMIGLFKAMRDYREDRESSFFTFADLCISRQLYTALEASNRKKHQPLNSYVSFSEEEDGNGRTWGSVFSDQGASPEQLLIEQEGSREFTRKLQDSLSAMETEVLELYLEGNSYTRIAAILGKTPKSVDNALHRIRTKIRQIRGEK